MDTSPTTPTPEQPSQITPDQLIGTGTQESALKPAAPEAAAAPMPAATSSTAPAAGTPLALSAADVAAAIAATPTVGSSAPSGAVATPAVAADQDVIEPEWVDKAEQVIDATQGDPYAEEAAIESLQVEYLQKRYGHAVKKPDDNKPAS